MTPKQEALLEMQHAEGAEAIAQQQAIAAEQAWQQEAEEEGPSLPALSNPITLTNALLATDAGAIARRIVEAVDEGAIDALKALAAIKKLEAVADAATNKDPKKNKHADAALLLQSHVTDAAQLQPEKKFEMYGATFTKTEVGTKYDWSVCNDKSLADLEAAAKAAADALKQRQEFLKTLPADGLEQVDIASGEVYRLYRPAKSSTSTVAVSFK